MINSSYLYSMNSDIKKAILFGQYCILSLDKKHRLYIEDNIVFNKKCEVVGYFVKNNLLDLEGLPILRCGFAKAYSNKGYNGSLDKTFDVDKYIKAINEKLDVYIFSEIDDSYIISGVNGLLSSKRIEDIWI